MIVERPTAEAVDNSIVVSAVFHWTGGSAKLDFSATDCPDGAVDAHTADAFLVALLPFAMKLGEDIHFRAPVSEKLLFNVNAFAQKVISLSLPGHNPVKVTAEETYSGAGRGAGVGTGFSCGVDSLNVVEERYFKETPPSYRLNALVFNDVGSHGGGEMRGRLFDGRLNRAKEAASALGMPLAVVRSNLPELSPADYVAVNPLRNISAALLLQPWLGKYYLASGYRYLDDIVLKSPDIAKADPILAPLLSTERQEIIAEGGQFDRIEKVWNIADSPFARNWLNVCTVDTPTARNCSACEKCVKTLFPLELVGKLDGFSEIFDLAAYRSARNRVLMDTVSGKKPKYRGKLLARAKEKGWPMGGILFYGRLKGILRKLKPRRFRPG